LGVASLLDGQQLPGDPLVIRRAFPAFPGVGSHRQIRVQSEERLLPGIHIIEADANGASVVPDRDTGVIDLRDHHLFIFPPRGEFEHIKGFPDHPLPLFLDERVPKLDPFAFKCGNFTRQLVPAQL
jgi:hypothetical protein